MNGPPVRRVIHLRLPVDLADDLTTLADSYPVSVSMLATVALRQFVDAAQPRPAPWPPPAGPPVIPAPPWLRRVG